MYLFGTNAVTWCQAMLIARRLYYCKSTFRIRVSPWVTLLTPLFEQIPTHASLQIVCDTRF